MAYRQTPAVRQRLDATRAGIVTAATDLVAEHGYGGCGMAAVAEAAGVGTGTIYGFFPGKGELFAEVFRQASAREVSAASAAGWQAMTEGSPRASILAAARTFCTRALSSPKLAYALIAEPVDPLVAAERLAFYDAYTDLLASAVKVGIDSGELAEQDPRVAGAAIMGAVAQALVIPLARGTADPAVVESLIAFIDRSLGHGNHAPNV
ncbi:TetR/AcrR family transcriptional regulator [Nocardia sp. NPDC050175]|uniref:TetR/AcrR family transcriptional regulator n=1 Tax=Nocardia sp. NPDC050175 TaxID=3364317 RepID=UPI00378E74ED